MFNSCSVLARNYGNDCLFKMYICSAQQRSKIEPHPRETAGLRLAMITLTLLDIRHCDEFRTECARGENSARTFFFFAFEAAEVLIEKLYTFASPSYMILPQLD